MHMTRLHGLRLIGLAGIAAGLLVGCSSQSSEMQELGSFDQEPISIGMADGSIKAYKKEAPTNEEAKAVRATKDTCNFRRPPGYYDQLEAQLMGHSKTVYTVASADAAYDVAILPNIAGYMTMTQFREDFGGCGSSTVSPLRMTSDWLVLASNCADQACNALKVQVDSSISVHK